MPGFKYKDLMISVGCQIFPSWPPPPPCVCHGWSWIVTRLPLPRVAEELERVQLGGHGQCFCFGWSFAVTYRRAVAEEFVEHPPGGGGHPCAHMTMSHDVRCAVTAVGCALQTAQVPWTPVVGCPPLTCLPTVAGPVGYPGPGPEELAVMKEQLRQALANIEQQEHAAAEAAQPQTEAEVETLQAKLHEALSELEKRKQELRHKSENK
jgi:hypothetical protein